jgi:hypothetical protein
VVVANDDVYVADLGDAHWDVPFVSDGMGFWSTRDTPPRLAAGAHVAEMSPRAG